MSVHVLVVDDNKELADNLAEILTDEGHTAFTAYSGEEALVAAETRHFDIVLTDIRMPGMDGVELITRLHERDPRATYLLMTAHASDGLLATAAQLGIAGAVLPKPLVIEDLLSRILGPSGTQLLLVEDDEALAEALGLSLRSRGYGVRVVHTMAEARASIAENTPTVAIVDVVLPDGNGINLIQELLSNVEQRSGVPVVLMTGIAKFDSEELRRLAPHGIQFLTKPFAPDALVNALHLLGQKTT
ncbi:MAG: response regulator [Myxococcales bacterium]|jgi:two-component system, response regulator PdtaR|nr:response regulator [Myxococcales bacterium]